jgi:Uma2 family endonuclease
MIKCGDIGGLWRAFRPSCFESSIPPGSHAGPTEFGVRTGVGVRYPDVVVDRSSTRRDSLACEAPIFLAEVLSPSTEDLDFTDKLREYKGIGSVQTYLICSQDEPHAWVWQRGTDGTWPERPVELEGREGAIALPEFGIELSMASICLDIPDPPAVASRAPAGTAPDLLLARRPC